MSFRDDDLLDDELRTSLADIVPQAVESRLRGRLAAFKARVGSPGSADPMRHPRARLKRWWPVSLSCAAAVLLVAIAGMLLRPRTSFAEVAQALLDRPWVHMRTTGVDQGEMETWFSPAKNVIAMKRSDAIVYEDYRLRISETYDTKDGVITRVPIVWKSLGRGIESMVVALKALLQEERPSREPLASLEFLGPKREEMTLLDQRVERVTKAGHAWLDYSLTVAGPPAGRPVRLLFRVDVATKLPSLCRISGQLDDKPVTREIHFDYPQAGPADLFGLGVPRSAKLVDRVPAGDVKRILEIVKAGRARMDNYRALFVQRLDLPGYAWWTDTPIIFYRKGAMLRSDYFTGSASDPAALKRPAEGEDLRQWWFERTKRLGYFPMYVVRGATTFTSNLKTVTDSNGTQHQDIASVSRTESGNNPDEDYPPEWSMRPEFACRPPMGIGRPDLEPVVDLHPTDGPAGCVLLRLRHTTAKDRVNERGVGVPDQYRYWLDPKRDYIAMRWDMLMVGPDAKEKVIESDTTEETARSPQGVWYATRIRRRFPDRGAKDKSPDQIYQLYVDFNSELPDSLFDPPSPGSTR
jgi:hypothetical protein